MRYRHIPDMHSAVIALVCCLLAALALSLVD
jgi:hypothetical protein